VVLHAFGAFADAQLETQGAIMAAQIRRPAMIHKMTLAALMGTLTLGMAACEKQGPVEKVGEEVDETVSTIKNGGKETIGTKLDDAADHVRDDAKDIGEAVKDK
jgi:hypothetical protein